MPKITTDYIEAQLCLPMFKQGDDLANHLDNSDNIYDALMAYADQLDYCADMVLELAQRVKDQEVEISADTHYIGVGGPAAVIQPLIDDELLTPNDEEDCENHLDVETESYCPCPSCVGEHYTGGE